jgi:integrase
MTLPMSRPYKHPKTGIYWIRKRIPADLVEKLGRREVTRSLDTRDPEEAKRRFLKVLAEFEKQWSNLRSGARLLTEREAHALAQPAFDNWLKTHRDYPSYQAIWHTHLYSKLWTASLLPETDPGLDGTGEVPMDNIFLKSMRAYCFEQAENGLTMHGFSLDNENRFALAKAIAAALQNASLVLERESHGIFAPGQTPVISSEQSSDLESRETHRSAVSWGGDMQATSRENPPRSAREKVTLSGLFEDWWKEAEARGLKPSTYQSYRNTFSYLRTFLDHDDARRVTKHDVIRFKDHRLATPSSRTGKRVSVKTVKDSDLSALKSVFGWAVENLKLDSDPASGIKLKPSKPLITRSKGFSDEEARAILKAALEHSSEHENPKTVAAKRWVPWLCAFTGARVGEMAQLRKKDVSKRDDHWVILITPDAGTVKTNKAREVVLHPQLLEQGFLSFVEESSDGPLFVTPDEQGSVLGPLKGLKNRLREFARAIVSDPNVAPNHGWRHRFKTVGLEVEISDRVLNAIEGHAARTVGDSYGDVTIKAIAAGIHKLPHYDLNIE